MSMGHTHGGIISGAYHLIGRSIFRHLGRYTLQVHILYVSLTHYPYSFTLAQVELYRIVRTEYISLH